MVVWGFRPAVGFRHFDGVLEDLDTLQMVHKGSARSRTRSRNLVDKNAGVSTETGTPGNSSA